MYFIALIFSLLFATLLGNIAPVTLIQSLSIDLFFPVLLEIIIRIKKCFIWRFFSLYPLHPAKIVFIL